MQRRIQRAIFAAVIVLSMLWLADYGVLRYRVAHQRGISTISVNAVDAVHLKNGKTEYYDSGLQDVNCVESLFPHLGMPACWKLRRNAAKENDYFKSPSKY